MKIASQVKLLPKSEQSVTLIETMRLANSACNYLSKIAYNERIFKQYSLHHRAYYEIREQFKLSAQMTIRVISKVSDTYKESVDKCHEFKSLGGISYDSRILSYNTQKQLVSIWTIDGRITIPYVCGDRQKELLENQSGESFLVFVKESFYIFATCEIETPEPPDITGYLGVDFGIVNIAATSDGDIFSGGEIEDNRRKFEHRRKNLQKKGTRSAKRKLKKISGKQANFQKTANHTISKRLVEIAKGTLRGIAIEDLTGIREATVRRKQRARHHNWSFFQLRKFIEYKCELYGITLAVVNPAYTSQTCPECGNVDKSNRKSQNKFLCTSCGYSASADVVAAVNIAARAVSISQTSIAQGNAA